MEQNYQQQIINGLNQQNEVVHLKPCTHKRSSKFKSTLLLTSLLATPYLGTATASEHVITQEGKQFSEVFLKVENNDIIRFINHDSVKHQIRFSHKGRDHELDELRPGKTQEIAVNQSGLFDISCGIHADMKLTIFVRPTVKVEKNLSDYIF